MTVDPIVAEQLRPEIEGRSRNGHKKSRLLTARDICALDIPNAPQLLGPLLKRGQRLILGAQTGHGKSTFCLAMLKAVTEETDFLAWKGAGGRALIIDVEQGVSTIKRRLLETGLHESDKIDFLSIPDGLSLNKNEAERREIESYLADGDYVVVVADPYYKLHTGNSVDEQEVLALMLLFDRWRVRYNFNLTLPAHCRKPTGDKFSMHDIFGTSAFLRGAEVIVGLEKVAQGYSQLHFWKDRESDLPPDGTVWGLHFDREDGFTVDPKQFVTPTTVDKVRDALSRSPGLSIAQLADIAGVSEKSITRALGKLDAKDTPKGRNNEKGWSLPDQKSTTTSAYQTQGDFA